MTSPITTTRWPAILLLIGAGYCVSLQAGKLPATLPLLTHDIGLGIVAAGWLVSAVAALAAVGGVFAGSIAGRVGARRMALVGMTLSAAGSAIGALWPTVAGLMLSRIVEGAGFIATVVAVPPLLLGFSRQEDQQTVMAVWPTYFPVGMTVMLLLTPVLIALAGWRCVWAVNAAIVAAWAALVAAMIPHDVETAPPAGNMLSAVRLDVAALIAARTPLWLGLAFAAYASQFLAVMAFLPVLLSETAAVTPSNAALLTAFVVGLNGIGNVLGGVLIRRGVPIFGLMASACIAMVVGALLVFQPDLPFGIRFAGACLFCFVGGCLPSATFARVPTLPLEPRLRAVAVGVVTQAAAIGQFIGPPLLAGVVTAGGSWSYAPIYTVACALICLLAARRATRE